MEIPETGPANTIRDIPGGALAICGGGTAGAALAEGCKVEGVIGSIGMRPRRVTFFLSSGLVHTTGTVAGGCMRRTKGESPLNANAMVPFLKSTDILLTIS